MIVIKTMNKLPDCCANCPLNYDFVSCDGSADICFEFDDDLKSGRKEGCPLVEVDEQPVNYGSTKSDDPISRQAALYAIYGICNEPVAWLFRAAREIEKLPSAQLDPCDVCAHKDDCGDMRIYCPTERRTDGQTD